MIKEQPNHSYFMVDDYFKNDNCKLCGQQQSPDIFTQEIHILRHLLELLNDIRKARPPQQEEAKPR
jgi:hypothetical protein